MTNLRKNTRTLNADNIKWKPIGPRTSAFCLNIRNHELTVVWTRGHRFSIMTMTHVWYNKRLVRTIECRGRSFALCLNELTQDRGLIWKTVTMDQVPGPNRSKTGELPRIVRFHGTRKPGREAGYAHSPATRRKMRIAQRKRRERESVDTLVYGGRRRPA